MAYPIRGCLGGEVSPLVVRENQLVYFRIRLSDAALNVHPRVFVEDYSLPLHSQSAMHEIGDKCSIFTSVPDKLFRESFGSASIRLALGDDVFIFPIEVLATKLTAAQVERMIRYLTQRQEHIIRVCLARTKRPAGTKVEGKSDPEVIISTAEGLVEFILNNRQEIRQQLRNRLVPVKIPAWKAKQQGCLIDPVDIIFNLDSLQQCVDLDGVRLRGRMYSPQTIDVTSLQNDPNVEENAILLGGLYSIRRMINELMEEINSSFKGREIAHYDKEYVSLGEMLIKLTGGAMHSRCEKIIISTESLIRMFERDMGVRYQGEILPRITPYARSSRIYRSMFEKLAQWYQLGAPSIDGKLFLIKLRSISKIFEFFTLYRLFDYLEGQAWELSDSSFSPEFDGFIPNQLVFRKEQFSLTLTYEEKVSVFSSATEDGRLVKINSIEHQSDHWLPDYIIRIDDLDQNDFCYLILDAKYSNSYWVENSYIGQLHEKYYMLMAVYDEARNTLSKDRILGVFAVFPEPVNKVLRPISPQPGRFVIGGAGPLMLPMSAGLPISLKSNFGLEKWLNEALQVATGSMVPH